MTVSNELRSLRTSHEIAVNAALCGQSGKLVLVHWFDMDENRDVALSGGLKNKWPFEVECIAIGFTTGGPATSFYHTGPHQHYEWALPVGRMLTLTLRSSMKATPEHPRGQAEGAFPELPPLGEGEDNLHDHDQRFAHLPWHESGAYPPNLGSSHLSLEPAEPLNYHPFGETETHYNRRAQVMVGQQEVFAWLHANLGDYFETEQIYSMLLPDMCRLLGYPWPEKLAA